MIVLKIDVNKTTVELTRREINVLSHAVDKLPAASQKEGDFIWGLREALEHLWFLMRGMSMLEEGSK